MFLQSMAVRLDEFLNAFQRSNSLLNHKSISLGPDKSVLWNLVYGRMF